MFIRRSHKIRLYPNNVQANYLTKAAGSARFAYNWALSEWQRQHESGNRPSRNNRSKQFTAIKRQEFPWVLEVTKWAPAEGIRDLEKAFINFFRGLKSKSNNDRSGYPRFKKKGEFDSFYIPAEAFRIDGNYVKTPKLKTPIKMAESLRLLGRVVSARVSKKSSLWYISIQVELDGPVEDAHGPTFGVDVGIKTLAHVSDGRIFENIRASKRDSKKIKRLHKALDRKQRGSKNYRAAQARLSKAYVKTSNIRSNCLHHASASITKGCGTLGLETLNIRGMLNNHAVSKSLRDTALGELLRQLKYKAEMLGIRVVLADRFYPSSKKCSSCGFVKAELSLAIRNYMCEHCGLLIDRDLNAAINLKNLAEGSSVSACRLGSSDPLQGETTDWAGIHLDGKSCL